MPNSYEKRLMRVHEYIHANPAGDLSLDALADVAVSLASGVSCDDGRNLCPSHTADPYASGGMLVGSNR